MPLKKVAHRRACVLQPRPLPQRRLPWPPVVVAEVAGTQERPVVRERAQGQARVQVQGQSPRQVVPA